MKQREHIFLRLTLTSKDPWLVFTPLDTLELVYSILLSFLSLSLSLFNQRFGRFDLF